MKGVVIIEKAGREMYSLEFPVGTADEPIVSPSWADGIKMALDYFRRSYPGYSLFDDDISVRFGTSNDA